MEPQFRFCTSADGTRIAFATYGSGPPLVYANNWVLSIDAQLRMPEARPYFDGLASGAQLIIFDRRGGGDSARDVDDFSPEAEANDINAVAEATGVRDFTLFADNATAACATYARGDRPLLRNVILWSPWTEVSVAASLEMAQSFRRDWSYARRLWASRLFPEGPVSLQRALSRAFKETVSAETAARRFESQAVYDLDQLLPDVEVPVLVIAREAGQRPETTRLAGLLRNSQLRFVPGRPPPTFPHHEAIVEAVFHFMGINAPKSSTGETGTAIILFADIVDSTVLTESIGDAAFHERSRPLDAELRRIVKENGGTAIDARTLGDGVLATFPAAALAVTAALSCVEAGERAALPLHLGIHAGDVIHDESNVFGGAVIVASRISGLSSPGEVLVSGTVRELARTSSGVRFEDRGEQELKGVGEAVRMYAVRSKGAADG